MSSTAPNPTTSVGDLLIPGLIDSGQDKIDQFSQEVKNRLGKVL
jgi:hypothetical protein